MASAAKPGMPSTPSRSSSRDAVLQASLEGMLEMLKESEAKREQLKHALDTELKEREVLVGSLRTALVDADAAAAAAAAAQINAEARIRDGTNELAQQLADAMERAEKARAAQRAAEATAAAAAERAALAEAEGASARREAAMAHEHVKAAEERAAAEARSTAEAREVAEAAAAEANAARSVISQARQALDSAKQELSSLRTQLDESEAARTASVEAETKALKMVEAEKSRAAEAFEAAEMAREEMKKAIAAERQRVASITYKEALHAHTIDEQAQQLEELSSQLADARAEGAGASLATKALANMQKELKALAESRAKDIAKILALDEQLSEEQEARVQQAASITALQQALTARVARETAADERARRAEADYSNLRTQYRDLRLQLAAAAREIQSRDEAAAQAEAIRRAEAAALPSVSVQTEFISMIVPLPTPTRAAGR